MRWIVEGSRFPICRRRGVFALESRRISGRGWLQPVQIIGGAAGMGGGREDQALVILESPQPIADIGGVIRADFWRDPEIGRQEGRTQLGDKFLLRVAFITEADAAEVLGQVALECLVQCVSSCSRVPAWLSASVNDSNGGIWI